MRLRVHVGSAILLLATMSQATVLTFDIAGAANGSLVSQSYGDNVTAATMGSFSYGTAGGFTPDVTVQYLGAPGSSQQDLNFWGTGYSDLTNVLEYEPDGELSYMVAFSASNGQAVTLSSFDLGNWGGPVTLAGLTVRNAFGSVLWQQSNISVGDSSTPHLSFAPNVTGTALFLTVDLTGLGGNSDNIGLDNLQFSQSPVPEPATMAVLGFGAVALIRRRKNR